MPKSFAAFNRDAGAWPSSASSSCRSTAWARRTARRRSTTSRGRTSATPASPIASCGTRRSRRSIRATTSRASASTARRPADRTRSAALLFHPEFYKAAVSAAGCHDNRMDKIWWNEQWMGWPIGPQYAASSNVDNAYRLQGKLLLVVGEMDTNVDPSSTMQVVNQLIKHNKDFDLLVIPGADHSVGRRRTAITSATTSSCATCSASRRRTGRSPTRRRRQPARTTTRSDRECARRRCSRC